MYAQDFQGALAPITIQLRDPLMVNGTPRAKEACVRIQRSTCLEGINMCFLECCDPAYASIIVTNVPFPSLSRRGAWEVAVLIQSTVPGKPITGTGKRSNRRSIHSLREVGLVLLWHKRSLARATPL